MTVAEYPPDGARSARAMLATTTGPVARPSSGEMATGATVNGVPVTNWTDVPDGYETP